MHSPPPKKKINVILWTASDWGGGVVGGNEGNFKKKNVFSSFCTSLIRATWGRKEGGGGAGWWRHVVITAMKPRAVLQQMIVRLIGDVKHTSFWFFAIFFSLFFFVFKNWHVWTEPYTVGGWGAPTVLRYPALRCILDIPHSKRAKLENSINI